MNKHLMWSCITIVAFVVGTRCAKETVRVVEKPTEVITPKEIIVKEPIEVIKEIPKEVERIVEKRVEVPAEIPEEYITARQFEKSYFTAKKTTKNEILNGIPNVRVVVCFKDTQRTNISEQEAKDSIELSLRKNGVKVNPDSNYVLVFNLSGLWDEQNTEYSYSATLELAEQANLLRSHTFKKSVVVIWENGYNGRAGRLKVEENINKAIDRLVIAFSNTYLSENPQ